MPPKKKRQLQSQRARASDTVTPPIRTQHCKVVLVQDDIVNVSVDAIVNAANPHLRRGGGVCGTIFKAAGPNLDVACAAFNGCATGDAVLTESFDIRNVKAIIHVVGPRVSGSLTSHHRHQLASSYTRGLDVCVQHGLSSIAFPCISTAIYGFPNDDAARVALDAVKTWLERNNNFMRLSRVVFCTYLDKECAIYQRLMPTFFTAYVDETVPAAGRASSSAHADGAENTADVVPDASEPEEMTKPFVAPISSRKRGRPQKTPTKGPEQKLHRQASSDVGEPSAGTSSAPSRVVAQYASEYRLANEVAAKDQWIVERSSLLDEGEIADLLQNPQTEMLTPAHVDTIWQHLVLSHKQPILLVSTVNSTDFDTNHQRLGLRADLPRNEWVQLASAAVPPVSDDRVFGDAASFNTILIPFLGIYEAATSTVHYYDSLQPPNAYTSKIAEVFLKETVKQLLAQYRPNARIRRYERRADSTYEKETDGSSCGFFVCFYAEAYVTLNRYSGFFMEDAFFIRTYRERLLSLLIAVHTRQFPDYAPLTGFASERMRGRTTTQASSRAATSASADGRTRVPTTSSFIDSVPQEHDKLTTSRAPRHAVLASTTRSTRAAIYGTSADAQITTTAVPSAHHQPAMLSSHIAHVNKEMVESLVTSMLFQPSDTAQFPAGLTPRAMFMYLRAIASMYQLPVAVASPLLSLQKVHGKNAVRDVGLKLHKPRVEAQYVLVPFPLLEDTNASMDVDNDGSIQWVLAIHAIENNSTVVYDPTKSVRPELLAATEKNLKNLVITLRRQLLRTTTPGCFSVADARSCSTFCSRNDSAFGPLALAECFSAGSVKRLLFQDFDMDKYKERVAFVFRQLHKRSEISVKTLPGCIHVLASQRPPVMTTDDVQALAVAPRRSTRVIRRAAKDRAAVFTRASLTLLRPMNDVNCNAHTALGLGCAAQSVNHKVQVYTSGEFNHRCPHCGALLLASETPRDGNQYTKCCSGGKVDTDYMRDKFASLQAAATETVC